MLMFVTLLRGGRVLKHKVPDMWIAVVVAIFEVGADGVLSR